MSFFLVSLALAIVVGALRYQGLRAPRPRAAGPPLPSAARPASVRRRRPVVMDEAA